MNSLIKSLETDYHKYFRYAIKLTKNEELAKDLLQNVAVRLLVHHKTAENQTAYIKSVVFNVFCDQKNDRIVLGGTEDLSLNKGFEAHLSNESVPYDYESEILYQKVILKAKQILPEKQLDALLYSADNRFVSVRSGTNQNTLKHNRRCAIEKLKKEKWD